MSELPKSGRLRRERMRRAAPWLVLSLALVGTATCTALLARVYRSRDEGRFQSEARQATTLVLDRLELYKAALRGAASLFSSGRAVTPEQFAAFVRRQNVGELYPGLLGIGWVRAPADVDAAYLEPGSLVSLPALASDVRDVRQRAMEVSRDRGGAQMTGLLPMSAAALVRRTGFVLYLPVYSSARFPPASVQQRRRELVGFTYAPILADVLFDDVLRADANLRVQVYDGRGTRPSALYYTSASVGRPARYRRVDTLYVTGHAWTLVMQSTPALEGQLTSATVVYAALAGLLASVILFALTRSLSRAAHAAEAADRAKGAFLATMSHELRTPLNAIVGYADLMDAGIPEPIGPRAREQVSRIVAGAQQLLNLVDAVLLHARAEAQLESVTVESVNVDELLQSVIDVSAPLAARKGLRLEHLRLDGGASPVIRTDPAKLRQIGLNLVANAIKFTQSGAVRVETVREPNQLVLRVSDTGMGIASEHRDLVFTAFWQADRGLTRSAGGAGLGLTVSRDLAHLLGGDLICESSSAAGSTFTLRLPLA